MGGRSGERTNERLVFCWRSPLRSGAARSIPIRDPIFFVLQCSRPKYFGPFVVSYVYCETETSLPLIGRSHRMLTRAAFRDASRFALYGVLAFSEQ